MRPITVDIQPFVIKGRRKSKLEAPKSKLAAALVNRKKRNGRRKQFVGVHDLAKDPRQFVPVRRKPLGEYLNLEGSLASSSPSMQNRRMSYAAAVQTGPGVRVVISPRLKKLNKPSKSKVNKVTADTKFQIFDEQPKPHIVRIDPKVSRNAVDPKARYKVIKPKDPTFTKYKSSDSHAKLKLTPKTDPDDADIKALELKFKRLASNAGGTAAIAAVQTSRNLNSIHGNSLTASKGPAKHKAKSPTFVNSVSYLSFHQERLQRIVEKYNMCVISLQSPEPMKIPQFQDRHFKYLEEASLLAQNRTMLGLCLKSDQLIS